MYDIIPDIHGQFAKLQGLLDRLGYTRRNGTWQHADRERRIVFLGDYIDRGPENGQVIQTVRELIDAGRALAIMGNHELNAIHYHSRCENTGQFLRPHNADNTRQHESFLAEFPLHEAKTRAQIDWMKGLPLFLELDHFRAVHACWSTTSIAALGQNVKDGVLREELLLNAASKSHELFDHIETLTKGPEIPLPEGYSFADKEGKIRDHVRIAWWNAAPRHWRDIALSVPDPASLPTSPLKPGMQVTTYANDEKPVFFGHYWLTGTPVLQSANALCLDYSAGKDGPLVAYRFNTERSRLDLDNIVAY